MSQIKMTETEATEWVYDQDEAGEVDQDQLAAAFAALHGRPADDDDWQNGLWSLCCNMTPNCGTRPDTTYRISDEATSNEYSAQSVEAAVDQFLENYDTADMGDGEEFTARIYIGKKLDELTAVATIKADGNGAVKSCNIVTR